MVTVTYYEKSLFTSAFPVTLSHSCKINNIHSHISVIYDSFFIFLVNEKKWQTQKSKLFLIVSKKYQQIFIIYTIKNTVQNYLS